MQLKDILLVAAPLIVIQLALQIAAGINLYRHPASEIRWNNKVVWAIIIIFGEQIGSILYFILGRIEAPDDAGTSSY
jgi:hypothetical protein